MRLSVAIVIFAAACGGSAATSSTTPGKPAESEVALPDGVPFAKLTHEQQIAFMKQKVMPVMRPIFQNHDAKDFAEFGCQTCHGKQAHEGKFDMPNAELPKLNFEDMSNFKKEDLEWMHNQVEPEMGKILNLPLYSKDNPTGFGCLACHTQAKKAG